ncbi:glutamate 5-kinase [Oribacterium sp. WCC10]|uniref:glutamate 5-kinase n=1 Tax=Oribacterium sp. WCC10 TaxID=1855343 RepID=UPI0008E01780|nr:glutamate 5-kinase [Oribacterium sp. WCC10]SFG08079.1 glutamate 5-kinase [Oribacterium sp. WCC10]
MTNEEMRALLKDKKRIVIKVGSASITHAKTGGLYLSKIEKLVRVISDLNGEGKDVILVSSGAIATGRQALGIHRRPRTMEEKQAFAAVGQARLMMTYQKLFSEYGVIAAQILLTRNVMLIPESCNNTKNTFEELLNLGTVPVVNENDTISTSEINQVETFGDNDQLAAIVGAVVNADLVILLSDIDGLFTDDPHENPEAEFIPFIPEINETILEMGKSKSGSNVGTGGMSAKLAAARISTDSGADMVIARFTGAEVISDILEGKNIGTLFAAHKNKDFDLKEYISRTEK